MSESVIDPLATTVVESYDMLRADSGRFPISDFSVIELSGEDRKGWLQGQATNNLRSLDFGASSSFCLCEPTGQIQSVCNIWSIQDRFLLTLPTNSLSAFLKRVEQMVIMEDVAVRVLEDFVLYSLQGPSASSRLSAFAQLPNLDAHETDWDGVKVALLRSNRAGQGGWDVVVPRDAAKVAKAIENEFDLIEPEAANIARLEAGIPKFGVDINSKTMPPELGQAFDAQHVSYNKGCYTGQEVLMRIHSRGHTNKTWMGLISDEPLEVGASVKHARRADAGEVTSAVFSPTLGFIGGAILRNEAAMDGDWVTVETSRGPIEAEVREMPLLRLD
ncbi:MAG: hypothetical protein J0H02_00525 [Armatimonadetes bacterium]|nr:hypothetical protein [Armatimonadota bacterium]